MVESSCLQALCLALFLTLTLTPATHGEAVQPRRQKIPDSQQCRYNPAGPLHLGAPETTCSLPVDDKTAQNGSWGPWSYPPICISANKSTQPSSKLCAYTLANFRGTSSISVLTTPETAASSITTLEDSDKKWLNHARGGNVSRLAGPSPCLVMNIPGKGRGIVARRAIAEGEIIMAELPVMLRPLAFGQWPADGLDLVKLLISAGNQLAERERQLVMGMARSTGGNMLDDIFNTNSFAVSFGGSDHSGLFPDTALLNHACKPNAFGRFSRATLELEIVTYRDIDAGEELTLSYVPMYALSRDRREMIGEWGFNCSCSLCSAAPDEVVASDRRRQRVQDILALLDSRENQNYKTVNTLAVEILDLCEKEGLAAQVGDIHRVIATVYDDIGDEKMAESHAKLAVHKLRHYAGFDNDRTVTAVQFLEKITGSKSSELG